MPCGIVQLQQGEAAPAPAVRQYPDEEAVVIHYGGNVFGSRNNLYVHKRPRLQNDPDYCFNLERFAIILCARSLGSTSRGLRSLVVAAIVFGAALFLESVTRLFLHSLPNRQRRERTLENNQTTDADVSCRAASLTAVCCGAGHKTEANKL
jgi:hypothetical protein